MGIFMVLLVIPCHDAMVFTMALRRDAPKLTDEDGHPPNISMDWFCWENLQETHGFLP